MAVFHRFYCIANERGVLHFWYVLIVLVVSFYFRYASNADYLSTDDLLLFLEAEQGVRISIRMHFMNVMQSILQSNLVHSKTGLEILFRSIENSNYWEVDIINIKRPKMIIIIFFLSNICFLCIKETSHGDVSFTHPKHMLLLKIIRIIMNRSYSLKSVSLKFILN